MTFLIALSNAHDTGHLSHGGGGRRSIIRLSERFNLREMNKDDSKALFNKSITEKKNEPLLCVNIARIQV